MNVRFSSRGYGARDTIPPRSSNRKSRHLMTRTSPTSRHARSNPNHHRSSSPPFDLVNCSLGRCSTSARFTSTISHAKVDYPSREILTRNGPEDSLARRCSGIHLVPDAHELHAAGRPAVPRHPTWSAMAVDRFLANAWCSRVRGFGVAARGGLKSLYSPTRGIGLAKPYHPGPEHASHTFHSNERWQPPFAEH